MTTGIPWHRCAALLSLAVAAADVVLLATGVLSVRAALLLLLAVELPLWVVTVGLGVRVHREARAAGADPRSALGAVLGPTTLRLAAGELRGLRALWLVARRRTDVPIGSVALPYGRGVLGTAVAFLVVTAAETFVLHVLLPAGWLRTVLTAVTAYTCVAVLGLVAARSAYPHHVTAGVLHLRCGVQDVLAVPVRDIAGVRRRRRWDAVGLWPSVEGTTLRLPSLDGTVVTLDLDRAQPWPRSPRRGPGAVDRVELHVDDPAAAIAVLAASRDAGPVRQPTRKSPRPSTVTTSPRRS